MDFEKDAEGISVCPLAAFDSALFQGTTILLRLGYFPTPASLRTGEQDPCSWLSRPGLLPRSPPI
jgi:hypothetical protein